MKHDVFRKEGAMSWEKKVIIYYLNVKASLNKLITLNLNFHIYISSRDILI